MGQEHIHKFSPHLLQEQLLLVTKKFSVFFFTVCMFLPNKLTSSVQTTSRCAPFNFNLSWFVWTFLMAYSKAKLKSNGDKAAPCLGPILIGSVSNIRLSILHNRVSFKDIFIDLISCVGIPNLLKTYVVQNLPPKCIIGFLLGLQTADAMLHCITVFPHISHKGRIYDQKFFW